MFEWVREHLNDVVVMNHVLIRVFNPDGTSDQARMEVEH